METLVLIVGYVGNSPKGLFKAGEVIPKWVNSTETVTVKLKDWQAEKITPSNFRNYAVE